jgi:hypothetical protein
MPLLLLLLLTLLADDWASLSEDDKSAMMALVKQ